MKKQDETTFEYLKRRCEAAGTNLTEVCSEAGVDRSIPERWKNKEPKSLEILASLETVIAKKEKQKD